MGGKVSKAKRACVTETTTTINVDGLSGGANVTKKYDPQCVSEQLSQLRK